MSTHRSKWKGTSALLGAALAFAAVGCGSAGFDQEDGIASLSGALTVEKCAAAAVNGKVTLCHATASKKNPYVQVSVSVNACRNGHAGHDGDFISVDGTCPTTDLCEGVTCPDGDACFTAGVCDRTTGACVAGLRQDAAPICTGECPSVDGAWVLSDGQDSWRVTLGGDTCDFAMTCPGATALTGSGDGRELTVRFDVDGTPVTCAGAVDGEALRFDCTLAADDSAVEVSYELVRSDDESEVCEEGGETDPTNPGDPGDGPGDGNGNGSGDDVVVCPCFDTDLLTETWEIWKELSSTADWSYTWELPEDSEWAILYWSVGSTEPYRETWVGGFTVQPDFCSAGRYQPNDNVADFLVNETITQEQSAACLDTFQEFLQSRRP